MRRLDKFWDYLFPSDEKDGWQQMDEYKKHLNSDIEFLRRENKEKKRREREEEQRRKQATIESHKVKKLTPREIQNNKLLEENLRNNLEFKIVADQYKGNSTGDVYRSLSAGQRRRLRFLMCLVKYSDTNGFDGIQFYDPILQEPILYISWHSKEMYPGLSRDYWYVMLRDRKVLEFEEPSSCEPWRLQMLEPDLDIWGREICAIIDRSRGSNVERAFIGCR